MIMSQPGPKIRSEVGPAHNPYHSRHVAVFLTATLCIPTPIMFMPRKSLGTQGSAKSLWIDTRSYGHPFRSNPCHAGLDLVFHPFFLRFRGARRAARHPSPSVRLVTRSSPRRSGASDTRKIGPLCIRAMSLEISVVSAVCGRPSWIASPGVRYATAKAQLR